MRTHGKLSTYINGKCRCDECRAANAKYRQRYREQQREQQREQWTHPLVALSTRQPWRRPDWYDEAACRGLDPELFFGQRGGTYELREAIATCRGCDVREECATHGLGEKFGVWGGTTERQRRKKRREAAR